MSSESVCQVARSWVDVGSFHTRLVVRFMIFKRQSGRFWIQPRSMKNTEVRCSINSQAGLGECGQK
jgi:hypothetical protein